MAYTWPKERRLIGTKIQRIDGPDKSTGTAKYSYDINRPGMLFGKMLRSPYAHCKITTLDTSAAEASPGFKAVHIIAKQGAELFYAGDEILAIAADTEEHAVDAIRAVKVEYEVLPHLVNEDEALKDDKQSVPPIQKDRKNIRVGNQETRGKPDEALKEAEVTHEGTYGASTICHQCLEPHGLVAEWDSDGGLTVWCSTQATMFTAMGLAGYFKMPASKVKCITHYMGGGYGSKFGPDVQGTAAAELARKAKAPVKLLLDRADEVTVGGVRPSAYAKVKIGGSKDGKFTAFVAETHGSPGVGNGSTVGPMPYVYAFPNVRHQFTMVRLNTQVQRAMRAPGHPQSCLLTEGPIDDFAAKIGMDPMQVRLMNLPAKLPQAPGNDKHAVKVYADEIAIAAKLSDWSTKWKPPGKGDQGPIKRGIGMALHTWGGAGGPNNDVNVTIAADGSVLVQCSTQDLGTGERTVAAIVAAEVLGLEVKDITVRIGESQFGRSGGSGGSTTTPGTAPAFLNAASAARDQLFEKIAPRLEANAKELSVAPGKIVDKANNKEWAWKEACAKLGMDTVKGTGNFTPGLSSVGVGGVQVAEVVVDTETGVVRCTKVVAVQDCGMIINKLCCESQVAGGVIMAVNYALFEERIMDSRTGRQVNPNMEFYKLGGIEDMPQIVVHMHDMPERGVIGIGEPPTISTCAAISNAIFNAIGVRVPFAPFTPDRVLAALAKKGGDA
jgi:xanthine dehydrogenase YagR molybdenum-binding subunit